MPNNGILKKNSTMLSNFPVSAKGVGPTPVAIIPLGLYPILKNKGTGRKSKKVKGEK